MESRVCSTPRLFTASRVYLAGHLNTTSLSISSNDELLITTRFMSSSVYNGFYYLRRRALRKVRRSRMATVLLLSGIICTLIAPFWFIYKPPVFLVRYFQHRWPDVLWRVPTSSKIIALTIDDGPSEYTNEILEILKSNRANATFFIIGSQVAGREETLQELVRNGNELGNHGIFSRSSNPHSPSQVFDLILQAICPFGEFHPCSK